MTNNEFLDDIERRGINGDVFTPEEVRRLWELIGKPYPPVFTGGVFMRGGARKHARRAKRRLIELGTQRMKGAARGKH